MYIDAILSNSKYDHLLSFYTSLTKLKKEKWALERETVQRDKSKRVVLINVQYG